MDDEGSEQRAVAPAVPVTATPAAPPQSRALQRRPRSRPPPVLDAEFRVVPPAWGLWRLCRDSWWALGPYLAYCTGLWGLAALLSWLIDHGKSG
ncbi:MAG TPA: hypothetical protein VGM25_08805 [Caulobacteraceae bacterium]|jgi:hypothetical protein